MLRVIAVNPCFHIHGRPGAVGFPKLVIFSFQYMAGLIPEVISFTLSYRCELGCRATVVHEINRNKLEDGVMEQAHAKFSLQTVPLDSLR